MPRKIYAGGEVLYGDERYCMRCSEQLNEDEGDKVQPWLDPHVCSVCRKKGGDADRIEWRLLNGGLFDECVRERDESGALSRVESARVTITVFKTHRSISMSFTTRFVFYPNAGRYFTPNFFS